MVFLVTGKLFPAAVLTIRDLFLLQDKIDRFKELWSSAHTDGKKLFAQQGIRKKYQSAESIYTGPAGTQFIMSGNRHI